MIQQDYYSGELLNGGSPENLNLINTGSSADTEAASMASFGKYDYDVGSRQAIMTQPVPMYNTYGGYGGYFDPYQQGGIGAPPPNYGYGYYNGYNPYIYGNPQPTYNNFRPYQQQQYQPPTTYTIPGININGEYLVSPDFETKVVEMEMEYFTRQQEIDAKQSVDRNSSVYGYGNYGGYNYYGMPYYNPYQYNALNNEFQSRIKAIQDEARETRLNFNMNISKLAHKFADDHMTDEEIREMYTGKTVNIPQAYIQTPDEYWEQVRLRNMVPFDNSQMYRDHRAKLQKEYNDIIPKDSNLKETFANMGIIAANWEMEDEMHRRRNAGVLYNAGDNSYKYFVRRKAQERYAKEKGLNLVPGTPYTVPTTNSIMKSYVANNPVLSQIANLSDDGTLNVSFHLPCNVGNHKGEEYTVHNSQEAEYEKKREKFGSFLNAIPSNLYLDELKKKKVDSYNG